MVRAVVVGVGNDYRGDDAAGLEVARRLGGLENGGDPAQLIDFWAGAELAVVVDAAHAHDPPGTIRRHEGLDLPARCQASTHGLSLADAVELGRALGRLPRRLVVYTVEGADFGIGRPMSPEVRASVDEVVRAVGRDLRLADPR
ncbi:hydrogenase maturation protease [Thermoactinospora rubra]|uniref:hydrogenase maturation protease n=1 Tax=Thermoactinospora rubra TaxID=1088767 RepID=UPI000A10A6D4|nr:hydrogenase maturation protease [Thermoactinospora rubra]